MLELFKLFMVLAMAILFGLVTLWMLVAIFYEAVKSLFREIRIRRWEKKNDV